MDWWYPSTTKKIKYPTHKKRAGGVAQVIECLPRKHEALSLNPSTVKKIYI
jgi:hypothetical protein